MVEAGVELELALSDDFDDPVSDDLDEDSEEADSFDDESFEEEPSPDSCFLEPPLGGAELPPFA